MVKTLTVKLPLFQVLVTFISMLLKITKQCKAVTCSDSSINILFISGPDGIGVDLLKEIKVKRERIVKMQKRVQTPAFTCW